MREDPVPRKQWESLSQAQQIRVATAIGTRNPICFDICTETCQIFDNVKAMLWFHVAVARELGML